jgi:predicted nucleic acid-binding protein
MKIYFDVCCLNRPFDDLAQDRVYLESDAILTVLSRCESGEWEFVSSEIVDLEISKITNTEKLKKVRALSSVSKERIVLSGKAQERARFFQQNGIKVMDSLHLAIAETRRVDVFLTTDDALLRIADRIDINILVANPVTWLMEVLKNE